MAHPIFQTNTLTIDRRINSIVDPYRVIDIAHFDVDPTNKSRLSISIAPGKKDQKWNRDLRDDLNAIKRNNVQIIVCLLEWSEMIMLNIADYPRIAQETGIIFYHVQIKDRSIPLKKELDAIVSIIVKHISDGKNILVHCRGGLGRAGTICACCLTHFGYDGTNAIQSVRKQRPGAIQTSKQEECVMNYARQLTITR
jgi:protein-tyrosine phosphatase